MIVICASMVSHFSSHIPIHKPHLRSLAPSPQPGLGHSHHRSSFSRWLAISSRCLAVSATSLTTGLGALRASFLCKGFF
jgi:hypothetical protein